MKNNTFKLKSFIDDVEKDLAKAEKKRLKQAEKLLMRRVRAKIRALGLVDDGDLLKGVSSSTLSHASLVGVSAPGFHALIVEYGSEQRMTLGTGEERTGIRSTGRMPAKPFFLPAFQESVSDIQKILSEEWL